jgi:hypothetical protein
MVGASLAPTAFGSRQRPAHVPTEHATTQYASLFSHLRGLHRNGALLIDENAGRVGGVAFGMTVRAAKRALPSAYLWAYRPGGFDLIYCARPSGQTCYGSQFYLSAVEPDPAAVPVINEIYLGAGLASDGSGRIVQGRDAITSRGVRIGDNLAAVKRRYKIAFTGPGCLTVPPTSTFYADAGPNLIGFSTHRGVVEWIVLLRGKTHRC